MIERLYLALFTAWRRLVGAGDIAFTGFWLGVLSRDALHRVDELMYRRRGRYHGEAHNLGGLFDWEEEALRPYLTEPRRVAVIGAGGGREVIALHRGGSHVEGFECNPSLVAAAQRLLAHADCSATVEWLPRDAAPSGRPRYSLIVVGWGAYMLMQGQSRRVEFLRQLAAISDPGSPVLISFFSRPTPDPRLERIFRVGNLLRRAHRRDPLEVGDDLAPNFVHRFTREEVAGEAAAAGMRLATYRDQGSGPTDAGYAILLTAARSEALQQ